MSIIFYFDKDDAKRMVIENSVWGTTLARVTFVMFFMIILNFVYSCIAHEEYAFSLGICIAAFLALICLKLIKAVRKASDLFEGKELRYEYKIEDGTMSYKVYFNEDLKGSGEYRIEDVKTIHSVREYSFITFNDGEKIFINNNAFVDGSLREFKEMVKGIKRDKRNRQVSKGFSVDGIC